MGFYVRHLKSQKARKFASKIEKAFLNPTADKDMNTVIDFYDADPLAGQDVLSAAYAVLRDSPQIYYYAINLSSYTAGAHVFLKAKLLYPLETIKALNKKIEDKLSAITSIIDQCTSPWEKERAIFEYMYGTISYNDDGSAEEGNIIGPLLLQRGVCEGISKLFAVLCHRFGIPCILVFGQNHMWNMVNINGVSAHVDVTWGIGQLPCNYSYFNISDEEILLDHGKDIDCIPKCSSSNFDFYHVTGGYFKTESELQGYLRRELISGKPVIHAKLENGDPEKILRYVCQYSLRGFTYTVNDKIKTLTICQKGGTV